MRISGEKLRTLGEVDWGVLWHCVWVIPAVEFSVRWRAPGHWLPAPSGPSPAEAQSPGPSAAGQRIARWVDAAYRRSPFRPTCLTRSLVLYRILRTQGIPCQLHIGLRGHKSKLEGHAWIESGRRTDSAEFEVLLSF